MKEILEVRKVKERGPRKARREGRKMKVRESEREEGEARKGT